MNSYADVTITVVNSTKTIQGLKNLCRPTPQKW